MLHSAAHKSFTHTLLVVTTACVTEASAESAEALVQQNKMLFTAGLLLMAEKTKQPRIKAGETFSNMCFIILHQCESHKNTNENHTFTTL